MKGGREEAWKYSQRCCFHGWGSMVGILGEGGMLENTKAPSCWQQCWSVYACSRWWQRWPVSFLAWLASWRLRLTGSCPGKRRPAPISTGSCPGKRWPALPRKRNKKNFNVELYRGSRRRRTLQACHSGWDVPSPSSHEHQPKLQKSVEFVVPIVKLGPPADGHWRAWGGGLDSVYGGGSPSE